ncbi:MAG: pilus assembly protein PilP [Nitrospiraceae bacterium]|nr:pilus assembly protein PilP [Nitrospiraceae bacterium]
MRYSVLLPAVILIALPLCAEGGAPPAQPQKTAQAQAQKTAPAQPAAAVANQPAAQAPEDETYTYSSGNRRDPFLSLIYVAKASQKKTRKITIPIEEYDISQFKLEAVVKGKGHYALVKLPNGKHYILREGMTAGSNGGKVVRITKDSMVVRETTTDLRGKKYTNNITLRLRQEEE